MVYDYLQTCFNLLVGLISQDITVYIMLVLVVLFALWIVLSLVYSSELKFARNTKKLSKFIEANGLNAENEPQFIALASALPRQFVRKFKLWKSMNYTLPEICFSQEECLETPLYGGIYNQNRSLMKTIINGCVIILFMFSIAIVAGSEEPLTGVVFARALVVPMFAYLLFKLEYYIYTTIRHYFYKLAVENYNELIDILNEKYELGEIELKQDVKVLGESSQQNFSRQKSLTETDAETKQDYADDEDLKEEDMEELQKRGRGRPRKTEEEKNAPLKIETEQDFANALARAEKLMARLHKPLSDSQKRRTNKELAEIMDKLAEFKKTKM